MRKLHLKFTLLAFLVAGNSTLANQAPPPAPEKTWTSAEVEQLAEQLKKTWTEEAENARKKRQADRENFLQFEALITAAIKQGQISEPLLALANQLVNDKYPLQEDIQWLLMKAKMANPAADKLAEIVPQITQFAKKFPHIAKRNQLIEQPISLYFQHQLFDELLAYAEKNPPERAENQCRLFIAKQHILDKKSATEPTAEQSTTAVNPAPTEQETLLQQFDSFRTEQVLLPEQCQPLEDMWAKSSLNTPAKTKQQAVNFVLKNAKEPLKSLLQSQTDGEFKTWLEAVISLSENSGNLQNFVENQPLDEWNKAVLLHIFPQFIKTLPEQSEPKQWETYQTWAEKFQLSEEEKKQWKTAFLSRTFDNDNPEYQNWRDSELAQLQNDSLLERRLRMAIGQKTDLKKWHELLSPEAKAKQEWRYWLAKNDEVQREKLLTELSNERGFYPMLAAHTLGKPYRFQAPAVVPLTAEQKARFQPQLDRIHELRELKRLDTAKTAWLDLLQAVNFDEKIALSDYALQQDWFDLAVEGTIQAKAWDYLNLRLPNAYSDWFDLHLNGKKITKSFAMAIARQESAWNSQARSHANAIGLMQMLPSTAKQTAENSQFPFQGESDLLRPFRNIMLGTAHLAELNEKYPSNRILIAAAYNAGSHRVSRWLERANGKLAMDEFIASIPFFETRGYVQNVLAYDFYYQMLQGQTAPIMFTQEEQRIY